MNFENSKGKIGYDHNQSGLDGHKKVELNGSKLQVLLDFLGSWRTDLEAWFPVPPLHYLAMCFLMTRHLP